MQPVHSCPVPEKPNGVLGQTLLGNPCKLTSSHCQTDMTGNPLDAGQAQASQPIPNNKERVKPPLSSQASASSISISRPRPTALPNKSAIKVSRSPEPSLQVKSTGILTESPLPPNPQLTPPSQLHLNPPSIPQTLPSPPAQPVRVNTHNHFITRPNPNLSPTPSPQPTQSPETQIPNNSDEEGDFR